MLKSPYSLKNSTSILYFISLCKVNESRFFSLIVVNYIPSLNVLNIFTLRLKVIPGN